jgi:membrane protein DedA with SNARE-associated domain
MDIFSQAFWEGLTAYGYVGVLAASFLGSLLPFVSGPYIPPIIIAVMAGRLDPLPTALASAAGAASAKLILFRFFKGGRVLISDETRRRIEPLERLVARHGWFAVLAAAATPLPDDIIYILLAVANYSSKLFLPTVFAGKLFITTIAAYTALYWSTLACTIIECTAGQLNPLQTILLAAASAAAAMTLIYIITRLDWQKILTKLGEHTQR